MLPQIKILILFIIIGSPWLLTAQNDSLLNKQFGPLINRLTCSAYIGGSSASNSFSRKFDQTAFNYKFQLSYKIVKDNYLYAYTSLSFNNLNTISAEYLTNSGNQVFELRQTTSSKFMDISVGLRYDLPQLWYIVPYLEAGLGMRNAYLLNTITDTETDSEIERFRTLSDWNYLSHLGLGIAVPLTNQLHAELIISNTNTGSLDLYLPPIRGEGQIIDNDPVTFYEFSESTTNLWSLQIGISLYLP